ncbi:radical SAM/SPASM domain-containing protein [Hyperthermus butylicus]|uniref:Fe-S osidoreductase n=1 Tax=Hyperthermus butylicus (strain DSM 5456 / JCM 9403 / PLM1-5) TaxID=415426 RepID=A2BJG7_HYPBU|nr:radical SAM protein [Hyperthermus butylicus]ABM80128.1 putative Fe-S osidoreductase [Hyperthermus butylicus DSM 5456]
MPLEVLVAGRRLEALVRVRNVIWVFTAACNLDCIHCYVARWRGLRELSLEEKLRLVREIAELGVEHVGLTGGEPLIHPHFPRLAREIVDHGMTYHVVTNATMVRREAAEMLARHEAHAIVSVDGPPEIHDRMRGPGAFRMLEKGVATLREAGVEYSSVMAVSRLNYRHAAEAVEAAYRLGAVEAALIPVMPVGRAREARVYVGIEEYRVAVKAAAARAEELGLPLSLWCTPFAPLLTRRRVYYWSCRLSPTIDIDPAGRLLLCDVLDIVVADASRQGLRKAVEEYERHPLVKLVENPPRLPEPCQRCMLRGSCRGGCYARALLLRGDLNAGDPLCPLIVAWTPKA